MTSLVSSVSEIKPYIGLGILSFGQTRSEIRSILGVPTKSFKKVPFAENETDAYNDLGLHLYYDPADRLESIDVFKPSNIQFLGTELLELPIDKVTHELSARGLEHQDYMFEKGGFSLYVIDEAVKGVTVFTSGYYDEQNPNSCASRAKRALEAWKQSRRL